MFDGRPGALRKMYGMRTCDPVLGLLSLNMVTGSPAAYTHRFVAVDVRFRGKADIRFALHMSAFDPKRTLVGNSLWVRPAMSGTGRLLSLLR